jgi:hypothetical protein
VFDNGRGSVNPAKAVLAIVLVVLLVLVLEMIPVEATPSIPWPDGA